MRELIGDRNLSVVYVNHPELLGFFRFSITGDSGFLAVFSTTEADGTRNTHVAADMDTARAEALVRKALGRSDIPVEIESVQRWSAAASWASRFQDRRVLLAGDAAHVMPPTGGFGGNTGVADAHNLAWKLAMVLEGTAGSPLLDTYDVERRSVSSLSVEQAYTRYVLRVDPSLPRDDMAAPLDDASIELGPIYRSAAVLTTGTTTCRWSTRGTPVAGRALVRCTWPSSSTVPRPRSSTCSRAASCCSPDPPDKRGATQRVELPRTSTYPSWRIGSRLTDRSSTARSRSRKPSARATRVPSSSGPTASWRGARPLRPQTPARTSSRTCTECCSGRRFRSPGRT